MLQNKPTSVTWVINLKTFCIEIAAREILVVVSIFIVRRCGTLLVCGPAAILTLSISLTPTVTVGSETVQAVLGTH